MEEQKHDFEGITDRIKDYVNLRVELIKLKAVENGVSIAASAMTYMLIGVFAILMLLTGILALGFYLGQVLNSNAAGFGILTGVLFMVVVILFLIKDKSITKPIQNKFIVTIFKNW
jgi:hypothetical protein